MELIDNVIQTEVSFLFQEAKGGEKYEVVLTSFMRTFCDMTLNKMVTLAMLSKCIYKELLATAIISHLEGIKEEYSINTLKNVEFARDISSNLINEIVKKKIKFVYNLNVDANRILNKFLVNSNDINDQQRVYFAKNCVNIFNGVDITNSLILRKQKLEIQKVCYNEIAISKWMEQFFAKVLNLIMEAFLRRHYIIISAGNNFTEKVFNCIIRKELEDIVKIEIKRNSLDIQTKNANATISGYILKNYIKELRCKYALSVITSQKAYLQIIEKYLTNTKNRLIRKIINDTQTLTIISRDLANDMITNHAITLFNQISENNTKNKAENNQIYLTIENKLINQNITNIANACLLKCRVVSKIYSDINKKILCTFMQEQIKDYKKIKSSLMISYEILAPIYERLVIKFIGSFLKILKLLNGYVLSTIENYSRELIKTTYQNITFAYRTVTENGIIIFLANIGQHTLEEMKLVEEVYATLLKQTCNNTAKDVISKIRDNGQANKRICNSILEKIIEKSVTFSTITICKQALKEGKSLGVQANISNSIADKYLEETVFQVIRDRCIIPLISNKKLAILCIEDEIETITRLYIKHFLNTLKQNQNISYKIYREIAEYQYYIEWTACICYNTMQKFNTALMIANCIIEEVSEETIKDIKSQTKIRKDTSLSLALYQNIITRFTKTTCQYAMINSTLANCILNSLLNDRKKLIKKVANTLICSKNIVTDLITAKIRGNGQKLWVGILITDDILKRGVRYICVKSLTEAKKLKAAKKTGEKNVVIIKNKIADAIIQNAMRSLLNLFLRELIKNCRFNYNLANAVENALIRICIKKLARTSLQLKKNSFECSQAVLQSFINRSMQKYCTQCVLALMISNNIVGKSVHHLIRTDCRNMINDYSEKKVEKVPKPVKAAKGSLKKALESPVKIQEEPQMDINIPEVEEIKSSTNINDINVSIFQLSGTITQKKLKLKSNSDLEKSYAEINEICLEAIKNNTVLLISG